MSVHASRSAPPARRTLRSFGAIFAGLVTVVALSTVTDQVLHATGVFPPQGEPMHDPALFMLALAYRCAFTVLGGYVTARLAPRAGLGHAVILGVIGTCLAIAGAVATLGRPEFGPAWYPIALVVTGVPCTWLGGRLRERTRTAG